MVWEELGGWMGVNGSMAGVWDSLGKKGGGARFGIKFLRGRKNTQQLVGAYVLRFFFVCPVISLGIFRPLPSCDFHRLSPLHRPPKIPACQPSSVPPFRPILVSSTPTAPPKPLLFSFRLRLSRLPLRLHLGPPLLDIPPAGGRRLAPDGLAVVDQRGPRPLPLRPGTDARERGVGNGPEGVLGEEALVRRDEDVGERPAMRMCVFGLCARKHQARE